MSKPPAQQYVVIRDTREKTGQGWFFEPSRSCGGTVQAKLDTGDYTIEGFETRLAIDRKGSIAEFATNIYDPRFLRELDRMSAYEFAIILLEFTLEDVLGWPGTSGIPRERQALLRLSNFAFLKRITELEIAHPHVRFVFAGRAGKEYVGSLFKRLISPSLV